jgi:hypothetical protein
MSNASVGEISNAKTRPAFPIHASAEPTHNNQPIKTNNNNNNNNKDSYSNTLVCIWDGGLGPF